MQHGSLALVSRKEGPAVWQFRWSEKDLQGGRVQRKRVIGTVERYLDEACARSAIAVLLAEINSDKARMGSHSITVAQLCDHFEQRELARDNTWRSYSTKKTYHAYLTRWVLPHWRQSAKRRRAPAVLIPAEVKALVYSLGIRERTLVLLAVSTGLRQSELFGLKWSDIDLVQRTMNVTRSIVYGVVGPCKTESSQKPVPFIRALPTLCQTGENSAPTRNEMIGFLPVGATGVGHRIGDKRSCADMFDRLRKESESRNASAGTRFVTRIRRC